MQDNLNKLVLDFFFPLLTFSTITNSCRGEDWGNMLVLPLAGIVIIAVGTLLGFFFPFVGLILWLIWREDMPLRAKSVGTGALVGAISTAVLYVLYFLAIFFIFGLGISAAAIGAIM